MRAQTSYAYKPGSSLCIKPQYGQTTNNKEPANWLVSSGSFSAEASSIQQLDLHCYCSQAIAPQQLIGQIASFSSEADFHFQGSITKATVLSKGENKHSKNKYFYYQLTIHDQLELLAGRTQTQVFRLQNSKAIIDHLTKSALDINYQATAADNTTSPSFKSYLNQQGETRPWVWQWQESDLALMQRLCLAENWHFFSRFNKIKNKIIASNYLMDYTTQKNKAQNPLTVLYHPQTSLQTNNSSGQATINLLSYSEKIYAKEKSCATLYARSTYISWQLGSWIKIIPANKNKTPKLLTQITAQNWFINKIQLPSLNPQTQKKSTHCILELKSLKDLQKIANNNYLNSHRYYNIIPATVTENSDSVTNNKQKCRPGFYGIRFAHEAIKSAGNGPYVPMLCQQIENNSAQQSDISCNKLAVGSRVLIKMLQGDLSQPIIIGSVDNNKNPNPVTAKNSQQRILRTPLGNSLELDSKKGNGFANIYTTNKQQGISLSDNPRDNGINIFNKQGGLQMQAKQLLHSSNKLNINSDGNINLNSQNTNRIICSKGDINLQAKNISMQSSSNIKQQTIDADFQAKSNSIKWNIKNNLNITAKDHKILFSGDNSSLSMQQQTNATWQAKNNLALQTGASKIEITGSGVSFSGATVSIKAAQIIVSGA